MRNLLIPAMFFMVFLFSFNLFADCTKDTDCKGKRICVEGECVFNDGFTSLLCERKLS